MPEISRFYGIIIRMFFDDHSPPHFHAYYGKEEAKFDIRTLEIIEGKLPARAIRFIKLWAKEHRDELLENWKLARKSRMLKVALKKIKPLQ